MNKLSKYLKKKKKFQDTCLDIIDKQDIIDDISSATSKNVLKEILFWIKDDDIDVLKDKVQQDGDVKYLSSTSLLKVVKKNRDKSKLQVIKDWIIRTDDKQFNEESLKVFFSDIIKLIDD